MKNLIFALSEFRSIQLQFATNRIKIGPLEPEIQPSKVERREVIGMPLVTISLVTLYNCFLTVENYTKDTQEISGTQYTDVVRGGYVSYIAPPVTLGCCAITFSPVK